MFKLREMFRFDTTMHDITKQWYQDINDINDITDINDIKLSYFRSIYWWLFNDTKLSYSNIVSKYK